MTSINVRITSNNHLETGFSWYRVWGSETNLDVGDVETLAEWGEEIFFASAFLHHNVTPGDTWYHWAQPVYDRGDRAGAITPLGALVVIGPEITNAQLADMPAWTIKLNNSGGAGPPQDVKISDLTEETLPIAGDFVMVELGTGELRKVNLGNLISTATGYGVVDTINFIIDNGALVITTGPKGDLGPYDYDVYFERWSLLGDQSGSIQLDLWMGPKASHPLTVANSITPSGKPLISGNDQAESSNLAGWSTTYMPADYVMRVNVDSAATIKRCGVAFRVRKVPV